MPSETLHTTDEAPAPRAVDSTQLSGKARLWTPLFVFIVAMTLCCFMVGQGLNSGTSVYLDRLGESATFAGLLATVFSVAAAGARIVCGPLIDRTGRYRVMVAGMGLLVLGTLVPALVADPIVFAVCRVVQGVGFSAATTASATAAADVLPLSRLGEGIGYYGLGQALAMSVGPALALFLVATDPAENLYFGLAAIAALGLGIAACCRYERNPARLPATSAYRRTWEAERDAAAGATAAGARADAEAAADAPSVASADDRGAEGARKRAAKRQNAKPGDASERGIRRVLELRALPGALPMLVLSPAFGFGIFFVGLYGTSLGIGNPGLFYTLSAVCMIAVRLRSKSFMDRTAPIKVFGAATLCGLGAFGLLIAAAGVGEAPYYLAGILYGVCLGVSMPLNQSVAVKNTPADRWGATNALYLLAADVGIGCSTLVWGVVNDACGFPVTIVCVMGCVAASFVVALLAYPKPLLRS